MISMISCQMPPKRDEAALQEEEELQLAIALSQSEAEEKERMVGHPSLLWTSVEKQSAGLKVLCGVLQRQKNPYALYSKAEPTPVTSSAPPVSTLYTSPVVRKKQLLPRRRFPHCVSNDCQSCAELLGSIR